MHPGSYRCAVILLLIVYCIPVQAQNAAPDFSYHVTVDLQNVSTDRDRVKITMLTPALSGNVARYLLPAYLPGVVGKVDAGRFIHQFYAVDDHGYQLKVSKSGNNMIVIKLRKGAALKKIEYWVDDTWDMEKTSSRVSAAKFNYVMQAAGSNFEAGSDFVLNHAFLFGYFEGCENLPYWVSVLKPEELMGSGALDILRESQTRDSYHAGSYQELIDSPVMYARPDTCGFLSGNIYISISVFSENGKVTSAQVRRLIAAQLRASCNFIPEIGTADYKLIFYFTTPFKTLLNSNGEYSGLAHRNSAFYFLPELANEDALQNELQRETSGDVLHLLYPLDFQNSCSGISLQKPQLSKSWWLTEGANMYFGWLAAVRDSFVNENVFMGVVSAKIRLSLIAPGKPISDAKFLAGGMKTPLQTEALRARAMLLAVLLDIKITEATEGKTGLREVMLAMDKQGTLDPDSLESTLEGISHVELSSFFSDYVNGTKKLPLIPSFEKIGWAYAPATIDSVLSFGLFGLLYNEELDAFFVHDADTTNVFGLRNGDRIVSVNNQIVSSANFDEALRAVYSPVKNEQVEVRYLRGEQNYTRKTYPESKAVLIEHLIRSDPAAGEDALLLHRRIFYPVVPGMQ